MPTWKLNPSDTAMESFLKEFIKRRGIDVETKRGQARVRAAHALIKAIATDDAEELVPYFDAFEEGDPEMLVALADDWAASIEFMAKQRTDWSRRN